MLGQPNFDDEAPIELLFIDANGTLVDYDRKLVPAPMREDTTENAQPLDSAWTIQTDRIRVPAPRLELGTP